MSWLHVGGFEGRRRGTLRREHPPALLFHLLDFVDNRGDELVEFLGFFQKIADVKEGVAIEANLNKGRLHAWQHASHTAFVNAPY